MFFKTSVFKSLCNEAYKTSGLTIGRDSDEMFAAGNYWVMRFRNDCIPNKERSILVELCGELPAAGEVFKAIKGSENQYELTFNDTWLIREKAEEAEKSGESYEITNVILIQTLTPCRILQGIKSQDCIMVNEVFNNLVDKDSIDTGTESEPRGPFRLNNSYMVYWLNETCTLCACIRSTSRNNREEDFLKLLNTMDLDFKQEIKK